MVRRGGQLKPTTWDEALDTVANKLKTIDGSSLAALTTPRATNEALSLLVGMFKKMQSTSIGSLSPVPDFLAKAEGSLAVLDEADLYLVIGADLNLDHRVAGIAIRRGVMNRGARLVIVDEGDNGMADLAHYVLKPAEIDRAISLAQGLDAPVVVYGTGAGELLSKVRQALAGKAQFVGLVQGSNARGAIAAGINGHSAASAKGVFILAADDTVPESLLAEIDGAAFVVAQTSYEGPLAQRADVVLPTTIWSETAGTFTNTEGRVQDLAAALQPPASVKTSEEILQALSSKLG
jgi:predicted molibdopterin-dependent oxidoreductase YjgC